jgi:hypothetical protein
LKAGRNCLIVKYFTSVFFKNLSLAAARAGLVPGPNSKRQKKDRWSSDPR